MLKTPLRSSAAAGQTVNCTPTTQLYSLGSLREALFIQQRLTTCTSDVASRCAARRLQLNSDKSEAIWFGSRINLSELNFSVKMMTLGAEHVDNVPVVHDLGVLLDSTLSLKQHLGKLLSRYCLLLQHIQQLYRQVGHDILTRLILLLLDPDWSTCNSILASRPYNTIRPLKCVQNAAVLF
jgi:hypothetical protein